MLVENVLLFAILLHNSCEPSIILVFSIIYMLSFTMLLVDKTAYFDL